MHPSILLMARIAAIAFPALLFSTSYSIAGDQDEPSTKRSVFADREETYVVRVKLRKRHSNSPERTLPVSAFIIEDPEKPNGTPKLKKVSPQTIGAPAMVTIRAGERWGTFNFYPRGVTKRNVMFMIFDDKAGPNNETAAGYTVIAVKPKPSDLETQPGANTPIGVGRN